MEKGLEESGLVDRVDLNILSHLRMNSRETLTSISKETGIPISSVFDRLKRLESVGVINRHTSLFDVKKIGIHHRVVILFKSRDKTKKEFEQWLMENQRINSLMKINGDWSFVAEAFFPDIKAMEKFTEKSREEFEIDKISILYILEDLKREAFLLESTAQ